jgi:hypothetical protein
MHAITAAQARSVAPLITCFAPPGLTPALRIGLKWSRWLADVVLNLAALMTDTDLEGVRQRSLSAARC